MALPRSNRTTKPARSTCIKIVRDITNQTERDCGYSLVVVVEMEAGDRIISGQLDGETVITHCATEIACESYLHNLACDRIAADAQERDLAVEAADAAIEALVADVAAGQPEEELPFTPDRPTPTPPAISYSVARRGFVWAGAPRAYPTFIAADAARSALLNSPPSAPAYPHTPREVRAELVTRGLLLAA